MRLAASLFITWREHCRFTVIGLVVLLGLSITACTGSVTGDPEEGGIIGTGIILRGIVNGTALASNNVVEVKSFDGQLTELTLDASNQYSASSLSGLGPWILRVRPVSGLAVYGIAYQDGTRNINRFSDVGLRSWFARQLLDLDVEFDTSGRFTQIPAADEYAASIASVFKLIDPVLNSYNVSGEQAISSDYLPNGQGVDAFLNRNTVLIRDNLVSFLYTDPVTNTQSETLSTLILEREFSDNGAIAPTTPGKVRAVGSAVDEIILVWEPSVDDVAVVEYEVLRDGALIATTPYPVYIDTGILVVQSYTYEIIAVDSAGNKSTRSLPALASPILSTDNIAPPAPSPLLELSVSETSVQLLWAQANIGDVVSFNLYRGIQSSPLEQLLQVTSTTAIDISVMDNEVYCYQVTAVDASGNESDRSDLLCVTTTNSEVSNGVLNTSLGEWAVPDLDSLDCEQQISNSQVQQGNVVIAPGCYSVPSTLSIGAGATLTLTEGTTLKFGDQAKLIIPRDATLTINGTLLAPVVLTGEFAIPGQWGGIEFQGSTSTGNLIRGAVIQYAGGADTRAALNVTQAASRFRMENTLVRFNRDSALKLNLIGIVIDAFQGNRVTENDEVGVVSLPVLQSLTGNSDFTGNLQNLFNIARISYTDTQISIPDLGIPYSWNGVTITRGSLTIEPGVELVMVPTSFIDVDGPFSAIGTEDKPILINGRLANQGSWIGVRLSGEGRKIMEHVEISYAGGASAPQGTGAIDVTCTSENEASVSIDNVDVVNSASWGIFIRGSGCSSTIGSNTYSNNLLGDINIP